MKFKGTSIITDPCYIIKDNPYSCPSFYSWPGLEGLDPLVSDSNYNSKQLEAYKEALDKYNENDDWDKCSYGENFESLGITHYISEPTIYGDWSCTTYKISGDPQEVVDKLAEAYRNGEDYSVSCSELGNFCADAGLVSVFLLDEVRKYNPGIDEWIASHSWCVTTIPDFNGIVEYHVDKNGEAHIVGTGNINFFTTQTSLRKPNQKLKK